MAFLFLGSIALRNGTFGSGSVLPEGTNALNASLAFWFVQHRPSGLWLYPLTDWGQPYPGFTGPTPLTPLILTLPVTVLVRAIEFGGFVGAGLSTMFSVRRLGGSHWGGFTAGIYYAVVVQTPQFFEGHVPAMISLALGPVFFVTLWQLLWRPRFRLALGVALVLYLLIAIGDLGVLYFYVFFAVPMALYALARRNLSRLYRWREVVAIGFGAVVTVVLSLSWLYPYAEGIRPEYTTNVTTTIIPFRDTYSENLGYALTGYVQDNSFIHVTYHQPFYSLDGLTFLPLFFVVPGLAIAYGIVSRRLDRWVALASAGLAIVFATGHLYPGLAQFNHWMYDYVPYFNAVPALYRWVVYSALVFSILIGLLITALEREAATQFPWFRSALRRMSSGRAQHPAAAPPSVVPVRPRRRAIIGIGAVVAVVVIVTVQNFALVTEPPGVFQYPSEYQAGYDFLNTHRVTGNVLVEPFSGIYERAPWVGVGASSGLMVPYYTGTDAIIFEAGTPYSLALDDFLGGGIVGGASRNMSSFLALTNIQYILANDYAPWSQLSAFPYAADVAYNALANQSGLGAPAQLSSVQQLYTIANSSGNISFEPDYLVYLGGDELAYNILNSPWYASSAALVNGSSVGAQLDPLLSHSKGVVMTPQVIQSVGYTNLADARHAGVPLLVVDPPSAFSLSSAILVSDPWNVSGGLDVLALNGTANASTQLDVGSLARASYGPFSVTAELAAPPGSEVRYQFGNTTGMHSTSDAAIRSRAAVNYSAPGFAHVNRTNGVGGFDGNVSTVRGNGTTYLDWRPLANDLAGQELDLNVSNLSGWNGFEVTVRGNPQMSLSWKLSYNQSTSYVPGYPTIVPTAPNNTVYRFILPPGEFAMPRSLLTNLSQLTNVGLVLNGSGPVPQLLLSNLSLLQVHQGPLVTVPLGKATGGVLNLTVALPPGARLGDLTVTTGPLPNFAPSPGVHDLSAQPNPESMQLHGSAGGWGIVTLAQTFSTGWSIAGPGPAVHAVVDIGLNGWFLEGAGNGSWTATYEAAALEQTAVVGEGVGILVIAAMAVVARYRANRSRGSA